ncbi:MAG: hypothetical protein WC371_00175, partial [Parachlamydiales bacterium]
MGKAYDAMFALFKVFGPFKPCLSRLFFLGFLLLSAALFSKQGVFLEETDISKVTQLFLEYHIENKTLTPSILRRTVKLYVEMFDADK